MNCKFCTEKDLLPGQRMHTTSDHNRKVANDFLREGFTFGPSTKKLFAGRGSLRHMTEYINSNGSVTPYGTIEGVNLHPDLKENEMRMEECVEGMTLTKQVNFVDLLP